MLASLFTQLKHRQHDESFIVWCNAHRAGAHGDVKYTHELGFNNQPPSQESRLALKSR
jgi:hypothetical protein